jgi:hypothetical protein
MEVNLSTSTNMSYYFLGQTMIAMSENTTLKYIHQACPERSRRNSLGSSSMMSSSNGTWLARLFAGETAITPDKKNPGEPRGFTPKSLTNLLVDQAKKLSKP